MDELSTAIDTKSIARYNRESLALGGAAMTVANYIKDALLVEGMQQKELASKMGISPQSLNNRLKNNAFSAEEWRKVAAIIGYEVKMIKADTDQELNVRRGKGRRVRQMVNKIYYDTYKAESLCDNFYQDGVNEYTDGWALELYRDSCGRFFVAHYTDWRGGIDHISPIEPEDAKTLYEKYGDAADFERIFGPKEEEK